MRILVSNDDGILAQGIRILANTLFEAGHAVTVVCPDRERSATGHALTMHKPLRAEPFGDLFAPGLAAWAVNGTPSDSVKLGLDALLGEKPDLVISGINRGPNLGSDVLYSGTVSAAMEGAIEGLPSIAVSLAGRSHLDFLPAARFVCRLVRALSLRPLAETFLLNVNVPALPESEILGSRVCRLGMRRYRDQFIERTDPRGATYYWLAGEVIESAEAADSDVVAVREGYIAITPLKYDLTYEPGLGQLESWDLAKLLD
ncbi:5'/3'-nucleotidase SurE [Gloeobacter kilaueensis]|uniref:5'-nucleotidase SurE n=1 Tax=Gloeobacter kilaueensis (strain ATCC BAA-2537 / CCAP 1431/1 / ULC 316 / JS1) TaxID=1183438 RepID=U5QCF1_GLOK1|nr:5'/3'-nucleotidase SurE [Gloeobacter kilaueensis]AGY56508.1 stationary phase survival protein SurE [Gloeobacter kilaueensis JS1]